CPSGGSRPGCDGLSRGAARGVQSRRGRGFEVRPLSWFVPFRGSQAEARMSGSDNPQAEQARGRYQVLGVIAHGNTGVVYRAMDTHPGWEVAGKPLPEGFAPGSAAARQFIEAAQIMGQLQHPGIPPVHDIGALPDGRPFFVMRLIRGRTLQEVLDEGSDP